MYRVQELLQGYTTKNKEPKFLETECLDQYVRWFKYGYHYKLVRVNRGGIVTDWDFVLNNIGDSKIIPEGTCKTLKDLEAALKSNRVKQVQFRCNNFTFIKENIDTRLSSLLKTNNDLKRVMSRGTKEEVLFLWAKIQNLKERDLRQKINKKYSKILNNKFGLPHLPMPILTINYSPFVRN